MWSVVKAGSTSVPRSKRVSHDHFASVQSGEHVHNSFVVIIVAELL